MTTHDDEAHCVLPVELIERILDFAVILGIHKQVLPQFCLSSRTCCALAQPRLFHSVGPTKEEGENHNSYLAEERIFSTLTLFQGALHSRPSLGVHVVELVIPADIPDEFITILVTLDSLRSLTLFGFWDSWYEFRQEVRSALLDNVFPKLHYLKLEAWHSLPFLTLLRSLPNIQTLYLDSPASVEETMSTDLARYPQDFRSLHLINFISERFSPEEPLSYAMKILRVRSLVLHAGGCTDPADFLPHWLPHFGSWLSELWLDWDFCSHIVTHWENVDGQEDEEYFLSSHATFNFSSCPALEIFRMNIPQYTVTYQWQYEVVAPLFLVVAKILSYDGKECRCPRLREFAVLPCLEILPSADFNLGLVQRAYQELDEVLTDRHLLPEMRRFGAISLSHDICEKNLMPRCTEFGLLFPMD